MVSVAHLQDESIGHPPNELALVECDRDELTTSRIRTFAEEVHPSSLDSLESMRLNLPAQGVGIGGPFPLLVCFHNCSPPYAR